MSSAPVLLVAALFYASALASSQDRPNFSGRWVVVSPAAQAGQEETVKHDGSTLTRSHGAEGHDHGFTYKLDGSESRNELASHGDKIVLISTATWNGNRLVLKEAASYPDGRKAHSKQEWSLDADGRLTIEYEGTTPNGKQERGKTIYRKRS